MIGGRLVADALGWQGVVVPGVNLLGDRVDVVAQLVGVEHERRRAAGEGAHTNARALTRRLDGEQAFRGRSPLQVIGILVRRARWASARRVARTCGAFGPAAAVVPSAVAGRPLTAFEADWAGVGLVALDGDRVEVLVPPPAWMAPTWTWVRRLGEETVYAEIVRT